MATKKPAKPSKGKASKKKTATSKKRAPPKRSEPKETAVILRRNASVMRTRDTRVTQSTRAETQRTPFGERIQNMDGTHFLSSVAAGAVGSALAVAAVGKGMVGPKSSAGALMSAGAIGMAVGWWLESDHLMTAGAGLTAAGTFSAANQFSVDAYEAMEERAQQKRAEEEEEEEEEKRRKRLAEARSIVEGERHGKQRNARRVMILSRDGRPIASVPDPTV